MKTVSKVFIIIAISIGSLILAACIALAIMDKDGNFRTSMKEAFEENMINPIIEVFHPEPTSELVERCINAYNSHNDEAAMELKSKLEKRKDYNDEMRARVDEATKTFESSMLSEENMEDIFGDLFNDMNGEDSE